MQPITNNVKRYTLPFIFLLTFAALNAQSQDIFRTACNGDLPRLDSMLQDTDINTLDDRGRSLLHWSVACRKLEVLEFLVGHGMETNFKDQDGYTALYMSVRFSSMPFLDRLIELQKDDSWTTTQGPDLMEKAVLNRNIPILLRLVESGVDINITNKRGSTPLEIARRIKAEEVANWLVSKGADEKRVRTFSVSGPFMGQPAPGPTPQPFAPNFISTEEHEFGSIFNAKGTEFYYGVDVGGKPEIRFSELKNGVWTPPVTILSDERYGYNDPFLSPDENRLYFISTRAMDGKGAPKDVDIWYVERQKDGWSEPINVGSGINSDGDEYYISITKDGTLYFGSDGRPRATYDRTDHDIFASKSDGGTFQTATVLGDPINTTNYEADVFVAPDESYLIFCSTRPEGLGRGDLYISFKNADNSWTQAVNMGAPVNTKHHELCPFVTADGKYLMYTSNSDIYWISADIIQRYRK